MAAASEAAPEPVVYAVPGSPLVAERTVDLLRADGRVEVGVLPALSFLDLAWAALGIDPLAEGVRLVDAGVFGAVAAREGGPFLVAQCWSRHLLSEVKLAVPDDDGLELPRPVLLHHLGLDDEVVAAVDWWELDRTVEPDHLTSLFVPGPMPHRRLFRRRRGGPARRPHGHAAGTLPVGPGPDPRIAHASPGRGELRGPGRAWPDCARANADAARAHLQEELGDLLFQIVFHARLADEAGRFDLADVARGVHDKLVHRHPHVFGDVAAEDAAQVVTNWEAIKKSEKGRSSVTEGIPAGLPALMLATKLARKARAVGVEPTRRAASRRRRCCWRRWRGTPRAPTRRPTIRCRPTTATCGWPWASSSSPWRTWRSGSGWTRNRRCVTVPCPTAPTSSRRRASPKTRWATANVVRRCPTRGDTQGEMA